MNPLTGRFEVAKGTLRRNGMPLLLPKTIVFQALLRAGWKGADGPLPEAVAYQLVEAGPFHPLFRDSGGSGQVA